MCFFKLRNKIEIRRGFSLLEVLMALSILTITLITVYQSFSSSLYILSSTNNLWRAMIHTQNELTAWERSIGASQSIAQGEFDDQHPMAGARWLRRIEDVMPFPGIIVRKVYYELKWDEGLNEFSYDSSIYIKPN